MSYLFIGILILVNVIQAFALSLAAAPHQRVILENTIAAGHLAEPKILELAKEYKLRIQQIAGGFSLCSLLLVFVPYESILLTLFWLLLFGSMAALYFCELYYIREMRRLLIDNDWCLPVQPLLVDTELILQKNQKIISGYWLTGPALLFVSASSYSLSLSGFEDSWILILAGALVLGLTGGSWFIVQKLPVRPLTDDHEINQEYNDMSKYHWSFLIISSCWILVPLLFFPIATMNASGMMEMFSIDLFIILLVGYMVFTFVYLYRLRKKQDELLAQVPSFRYSGDDQYWRFGVYINPDDLRVFITNRIGTQIGLNLGRLPGKIMMGVTGLIIFLALIITLVPAYLYDFTENPFQLEQTQETITMKAPFAPTSTIEINDILELKLIDKVEGKIIKSNGTATDDYAIGKFMVDGRASTFYIDHHSEPILQIETKNRTYYYTNRDSQKTLALYEQLQQARE